MILSTSTIILSLLIHDPLKPKALEKLSKDVIETLIMSPSEVSNPFNFVTLSEPHSSTSVRIREGASIQQIILTSLATIRNETALQQALSQPSVTKEAEDIKRAIELSNLTKIEEDNLRSAIAESLVTKEEEDLKRATELSNLTKIEEDNLRSAIAESLVTKEEEDLKRAIELSNLTKIEEDNIRLTTNNALKTEHPSATPAPTSKIPETMLAAPQATQNDAPAAPAVVPQTAEVTAQPEQNIVAAEPAIVPETMLAAPQAIQNDAPAAPAIVPETTPVAPQLPREESSVESTAIPNPPIPPALPLPLRILNNSSMPKLEKMSSSQKSNSLQESESSNNLLSVLLQSKIASHKEEGRKDVTLAKEALIEALKRHQDEIGLSEQDLQLLETQSLDTLQPIINEFYNEEEKEWDFGFADQESIMSYITFAPKEEAKIQTKSVGRLNIQKNETNLTTALREARGSIKNEETTITSASVNTHQNPTKIASDPKVSVIPQAPAAPKVLSSKAQETLVQLKKNREAAKADSMTLLEQILNKDTLVKLKTPAPRTSELNNEPPKSLNNVLAGSLAARRKSMEIDDESFDDDSWD